MAFIDSLDNASLGLSHIFSLGQAGYVLKSRNGQRLGIDLYLSKCVELVEGHDGFHRLMPQIVKPEDLALDVLIATHFHRDHFDVDAVPEMMANGKTVLFCALDCMEDVKQLGIEESRVIYVRPGDRHKVGDFDIRFVHSDHGEGAPLEVGALISVDGKNVLEVGDTSLHIDWKDEYLCAGPLDILIAPINGAYGNMNEKECVELAECLEPKITVPSHFGMFPSHGGNPGLFVELMRKHHKCYRILTMGEDWIVL